MFVLADAGTSVLGPFAVVDPINSITYFLSKASTTVYSNGSSHGEDLEGARSFAYDKLTAMVDDFGPEHWSEFMFGHINCPEDPERTLNEWIITMNDGLHFTREEIADEVELAFRRAKAPVPVIELMPLSWILSPGEVSHVRRV